jgi:hypothetical protein
MENIYICTVERYSRRFFDLKFHSSDSIRIDAEDIKTATAIAFEQAITNSFKEELVYKIIGIKELNSMNVEKESDKTMTYFSTFIDKSPLVGNPKLIPRRYKTEHYHYIKKQ